MSNESKKDVHSPHDERPTKGEDHAKQAENNPDLKGNKPTAMVDWERERLVERAAEVGLTDYEKLTREELLTELQKYTADDFEDK